MQSILALRSSCATRAVLRQQKVILNTPRRCRFSSSPSAPPPPGSSSSPSAEWSWLPSLLGRLTAAFGMVHVVSEYGVELVLCEGPSMLPTIHPRGEVIVVDRLTPRLFKSHWKGNERVQRARQRQDDYEQGQTDGTWHERVVSVQDLTTTKWSRLVTLLTSGLDVGDVVVVQHPHRPGTVCKRILGMPGDMVVLNNHSSSSSSFSPKRQLPSRKKNLLIVPDGHVWLEGDNSLNSSDSRVYGPLPAAMIVGRVLFRVWPLRGNALMERGGRPMPPPGLPFTGSTVLPAGYEGEEIVRHAKHGSDTSPQR